MPADDSWQGILSGSPFPARSPKYNLSDANRTGNSEKSVALVQRFLCFNAHLFAAVLKEE
jgi:hypothetical protein